MKKIKIETNIIRTALLVIFLSAMVYSQAQQEYNMPEIELYPQSGYNRTNSLSFTENGKAFICFFSTWCPPSHDEFNLLYEEGIIDLCKEYNVNRIIVTDEWSFKFKYGRIRGDWPQTIANDFLIFVDPHWDFLCKLKGNTSFPFACLVDKNNTIIYSHCGIPTPEKLNELKEKIVDKQ